MGIGNALSDRQPQTITAGGSGTGRVAAVEPLEDLLLFRLRNALAGVIDLQRFLVLYLLQRHPNFSVFLAVFQGVVHEDTHQLFDLVGVAVVGNQALGAVIEKVDSEREVQKFRRRFGKEKPHKRLLL